MDQSASLLINLPGQQAAQYLTLSSGFQSFDAAIAGQATITSLAAGAYTLTSAEFLNAVLIIPALTAPETLTVAARPKSWLIDNTAAGYAVTVQAAGQGSPPVIPAGAIALARCNGTAVSLLQLFGVPVSRDLPFYSAGAPAASAVVGAEVFTTTFTLPAALAGSQAAALVAAGADAMFTLAKNGTSFGSITFHTTGTPTLAAASATSFAPGDVLTITAPGTADADLAGILVTLRGVVG